MTEPRSDPPMDRASADLIVDLLREMRERADETRVLREMVSVSLELLADREATILRQRRQLDALREELRQYTSRLVAA